MLFASLNARDAPADLIFGETGFVTGSKNPSTPPISGVACSVSDNAKFSPDGTKSVFVQFDCINQPTLWIMKADGSGKHDTGIVVGGKVFMSGGVGVPDWGTNQN